MTLNQSLAAIRIGSAYIGKKIAPTEVFRRALLHEPPVTLANSLATSPQLVVLFTWIGAKEKTAHRFVEAWNNRGFHVLHVTSTVMDLVRPMKGTEVTALKTAEFINKYDKYSVIIHGLSVGGYLGQRVMLHFREQNSKSNITHQIYDSFTQIAGFESGVEYAVSPKIRTLVRGGVKLYTKLADLSCLYKTNDYIMNVPAESPILFMHSLSDKVANFNHVKLMMPSMARGNPVDLFVVPKADKIPHVALLRHMGEQPYMSVITRFLANNKFRALIPTVLQEEDPNGQGARLNQSRTSPVAPLVEST